MATFLNVLQTALLCYIFLVPLARIKGKLKLIMIAVDFAFMLALLLIYIFIANILSLSFPVTGFTALILTLTYTGTLIYFTNKYHVQSVPRNREKRSSSRDREEDDPYLSSDYDIEDSFDSSVGRGTQFKRDSQYPRRGADRDMFGLSERAKPEKTITKPDSDYGQTQSMDKPFADSFDIGLGVEKAKNDFSNLDDIFAKGNISKSDEVRFADSDKPTPKNKEIELKNVDDSKQDDLLADFLFDFGEAPNRNDTGSSSKPMVDANLGDFDSFFDSSQEDKFGTAYASGAGADVSGKKELSLGELIGDFSFLKGTLAKTDSKFMNADMDLEYVLLENINAQNVRAKIIDKNTIYINKFASEIILANAQRLLIENNLTDAKKLLAQLCCSSTDSAISNEAYVCYKEIVLGKDSDLEVDDLINAMIEKEEKLLELVKQITERQN